MSVLSLADRLLGTADRWPAREAFVCGDARASFGEVAKRLRRTTWLYDSWVSEGNRRIAIMLPNCLQYVETLFGALAGGCVAIPLDPRLRHRDLTDVVRAADPSTLVVATRTAADTLRRSELRGPRIVAVEEVEVASTSSVRAPEDGPHRLRSDLAMIFYTSGTTAAPQAVRHTHASLSAGLLDLGPEQMVWFTPNPFHTMLGHTVVTQALLGGHVLVTQPAFDPRIALELVEREQVTVIATSPPLMELMVRCAGRRTYDTSSVRYIGLGGSNVSCELTRTVEDIFGCPVIAAYGSTELGGYAAVTGSGGAQLGANSSLADLGADLRVVDEEGRDALVDHVGELLARGSTMMASYDVIGAGREQIDDDGWFHTGDLAKFDRDGNLHIVGRREDLVVRGGDKVSLSEIEQSLFDVPFVARAAVVSVDRRRPEIWAFVTLQQPRATTATHLHEILRASIAAYKVPDRVTVVREFPLSADGKIRRTVLPDLAGADVLDRHP